MFLLKSLTYVKLKLTQILKALIKSKSELVTTQFYLSNTHISIYVKVILCASEHITCINRCERPCFNRYKSKQFC